jgi:hypothetical protein
MRVSLLSDDTLFTMKSMKGWFVVNPGVFSDSKAFLFLTQSRKVREEIWVSVSFFAQWKRHKLW